MYFFYYDCIPKEFYHFSCNGFYEWHTLREIAVVVKRQRYTRGNIRSSNVQPIFSVPVNVTIALRGYHDFRYTFRSPSVNFTHSKSALWETSANTLKPQGLVKTHRTNKFARCFYDVRADGVAALQNCNQLFSALVLQMVLVEPSCGEPQILFATVLFVFLISRH